jgi:iron complex outermembrane receptor protein
LIVFENGNFANINAQTKGVEMALEGTWSNVVRGRASYTLQNAENRSQSQNLPDSPHHLVKFNLSVPLFVEKVFAGLEFQFTGSRNTFFTTTTGATLPGMDTSGYGVVNFTLFTQNLIKNLDFSATVYNLLDEQYADPATHFHLQDQIPRDGRSFRLKLTYRF